MSFEQAVVTAVCTVTVAIIGVFGVMLGQVWGELRTLRETVNKLQTQLSDVRGLFDLAVSFVNALGVFLGGVDEYLPPGIEWPTPHPRLRDRLAPGPWDDDNERSETQ